MKRRSLMKELQQIAKAAGVEFVELEGSKHSKVLINGTAVTVPRHREVGEGLAASIIKQAKEAAK